MRFVKANARDDEDGENANRATVPFVLLLTQPASPPLGRWCAASLRSKSIDGSHRPTYRAAIMSANTTKSLVAFSIAVALAGCENRLIKDAKAAVSESLNDPESARFTKMEVCSKPNAVQGYVNAKNLFNAYVGAKHFFYADGEFEILGDNADFDKYERLSKLCWSDSVLKETDALANNADAAADLLEKAADPPTNDLPKKEKPDEPDDTGNTPGAHAGGDNAEPMDDIPADYEPDLESAEPETKEPPTNTSEPASVVNPQPTVNVSN